MRVAFHVNEINLRGTSVALHDYAHYNRTLLGNDSIVLFERNNPRNEAPAIEHFKSRFALFPYDDFAQVDDILRRTGSDACYYLKSGERDGKVNVHGRCAVHVVFQAHEPHGDVYAYVSEWLSQKMTGGKAPFVPHIVRLPPPSEDLRPSLGIPKDAVVLGRHGGPWEFDLDFARRAVVRAAKENPRLFFLFLNTDRFCEPLSNIIHLPGAPDLQFKSNFVNSCDAMIHGRRRGESFGLAIAEFLFFGKPVFAWNGGLDLNHLTMLGGKGITYGSEEELFGALRAFDPRAHDPAAIRALVRPFTPTAVMDKFAEVFLGRPRRSPGGAPVQGVAEVVDRPKVDIVIPTYNNLKYLRACIESVRRNTSRPSCST